MHFPAPSTDALWMLVSTPHPVVGKARHLGEALLHAGMISRRADQQLAGTAERTRTKATTPIGQILVEQGDLSAGPDCGK
jgi:hypothetical protein